MGRLYRPPIPIEVKLRVVLRQLGYQQGGLNEVIRSAKKRRVLGATLEVWLVSLAAQRGWERKDLRLDHDPPLGARPRRRAGLGRKTYYTPDANDPDHLFYRPHGPEHAGSHLVKTNVRGDHGQHPDRVLIKKARRRERSRDREKRRKSTGFPKNRSQVKRVTGYGRATKQGTKAKRDFIFSTDKSKLKVKWPKRPFRRKP